MWSAWEINAYLLEIHIQSTLVQDAREQIQQTVCRMTLLNVTNQYIPSTNFLRKFESNFLLIGKSHRNSFPPHKSITTSPMLIDQKFEVTFNEIKLARKKHYEIRS